MKRPLYLSISQAAYVSVRQNNSWKAFTTRTAAAFMFLHDYAMLVPEAIAALEEREAALSMVSSLQMELDDKQKQLAKVGVAE